MGEQAGDENVQAVDIFMTEEFGDEWAQFVHAVEQFRRSCWIRPKETSPRSTFVREAVKYVAQAMFGNIDGASLLATAWIEFRAEQDECYAANCDARQMESYNPSHDYETEHDDEGDHGYASEYMNRRGRWD